MLFFWPCQGALTICMENPVIPGRIQMERFIPVEIFPFSRFYRYDQNIWYHLSSQYLACLEAESDLFQPRPTLYLVFCNGTTLTHSSFRKRFQVQYHLSETFDRDFLTNGKRSSYCFFYFLVAAPSETSYYLRYFVICQKQNFLSAK